MGSVHALSGSFVHAWVGLAWGLPRVITLRSVSLLVSAGPRTEGHVGSSSASALDSQLGHSQSGHPGSPSACLSAHVGGLARCWDAGVYLIDAAPVLIEPTVRSA